MNIQDELQKIHYQYGMSDVGNYHIQKLFDKQIKNSDFMACHFAKQLLAMPKNKLESKTVREHYDDFKKRYLEDNSSN